MDFNFFLRVDSLNMGLIGVLCSSSHSPSIFQHRCLSGPRGLWDKFGVCSYFGRLLAGVGSLRFSNSSFIPFLMESWPSFVELQSQTPTSKQIDILGMGAVRHYWLYKIFKVQLSTLPHGQLAKFLLSCIANPPSLYKNWTFGERGLVLQDLQNLVKNPSLWIVDHFSTLL